MPFLPTRRVFLVTATAVACGSHAADINDERKAFIDKLIRAGVFQKIEKPGTIPRVWVRPAFYELDFEMKSKFVSVVYAYFHSLDPQCDYVAVYDSKTGRRTGRYAVSAGGLAMD